MKSKYATGKWYIKVLWQNIHARILVFITDLTVPMEYPAYIIERSTPDLGCLQCNTPGRQTDWQKLNSGTAIQVPAKFLSFLTQNTHNAACDKPTVTERGRYQRKKARNEGVPYLPWNRRTGTCSHLATLVFKKPVGTAYRQCFYTYTCYTRCGDTFPQAPT